MFAHSRTRLGEFSAWRLHQVVDPHFVRPGEPECCRDALDSPQKFPGDIYNIGSRSADVPISKVCAVVAQNGEQVERTAQWEE